MAEWLLLGGGDCMQLFAATQSAGHETIAVITLDIRVEWLELVADA